MLICSVIMNSRLEEEEHIEERLHDFLIKVWLVSQYPAVHIDPMPKFLVLKTIIEMNISDM